VTESEKIAVLEQRVERLERFCGRLQAAILGKAANAPTVASDAELDSKFGDPVVRKDPKRWDGPSFQGQPFSRCTPEFLDCLAAFFEWKSEKENEDPEKKKYADYSRKDAARARGWAARIRKGWMPPVLKPSAGVDDPYREEGF
jgi:hypothetical protein